MLFAISKTELQFGSITYMYWSCICLQNFSIIYIRMGFPRLAPDKQAELVPLLFRCLEGKPKAQQDRLLNLSE